MYRICCGVLGLNLFCYFYTILGDSGVPESVYYRYYIAKYKEKTEEEIEGLEFLDQPNYRAKRIKIEENKYYTFCEKCNLKFEKGR